MNHISLTYMLETIGERLRLLRERRNWSIDELAQKCELTAGHIGRIERGDSKNPRFETIEVLAKALEVAPALILYGEDGETKGEGRPTSAFDPPSYIPFDIPVVGLTKAGRGGFYDDMGYPVGEGFRKVHRPIDVKDPNAYALVVEGDSTSPMLERGWIVYVCPNHTYENGDLVVAALRSDEVMIKKLRKAEDMLILQSINPAYEPLILVPEGFKFIHKVCLIKPK